MLTQLNLADRNLCDKYDKFIETSPYGSLLQSRAWAQVKGNWEVHCFYAKRDDQIIGALTVLSIFDQRVGHTFFYAPRGPVVDPSDKVTLKSLIDEALAYAKVHDGFLLRIEPKLEDTADNRLLSKDLGLHLRCETNCMSQPPMSTVLDLGKRSIEEIFGAYSKNTRRTIRNAYRHNLQLYIGNRDDLPVFYELIKDMSKRKGITHRSLEYFEAIYDTFKEHIHLSFVLAPALAENECSLVYDSVPQIEPIFVRDTQLVLAGSMAIHYGNSVIALYGADPLYRNFNQSYLLDFEEIRYAYNLGCRYYDMGGIYSAEPENNLASFKLKITQQGLVRWLGAWEFPLKSECYHQWQKGLKVAKDCMEIAREERHFVS